RDRGVRARLGVGHVPASRRRRVVSRPLHKPRVIPGHIFPAQKAARPEGSPRRQPRGAQGPRGYPGGPGGPAGAGGARGARGGPGAPKGRRAGAEGAPKGASGGRGGAQGAAQRPAGAQGGRPQNSLCVWKVLIFAVAASYSSAVTSIAALIRDTRS